MADFNGDGLPDIVVTDQASGEVTVLLNDPTHTLQPVAAFPPPARARTAWTPLRAVRR